VTFKFRAEDQGNPQIKIQNSGEGNERARKWEIKVSQIPCA